MHDSNRSIGAWHWAASGKHPAAKDFLEAGEPFPLFIALTEWMEKGYPENATADPAQLHSWRFWARGGRKEHMVCGLLKDSCDNLGRPFPLLVMGNGELESWAEHWDLLPLACETTWGQMESFSTRQYANFEELENGLTSIRAPAPRWDHFKGTDFSTYTSSPSRELIQDFQPGEVCSIPLEPLPSHEQKMQILAWHRLCKNHINDLPIIVFMGDAGESPHLFIARRALLPEDFLKLWNHTVQEN
jgi:type VI secretion system protein VasJ